MTETLEELKSRVERQIRDIVTEGQQIPDCVRGVVSTHWQHFQCSAEGLPALFRAVIEGAASALSTALPASRESALRQVVDGLGAACSQAALATRLAVEESYRRNERFASEDLKRVKEDFGALGALFSETVTRGVKALHVEASSGIDDIRQHADSAFDRARSAVQSALHIITDHPGDIARETVETGVKASRQIVGHLFSSVGKLLEESSKTKV